MTQSKYEIILWQVGEEPLRTMKLLRQATGRSLAEVKALVERAPVAVCSCTDGDEALALAKQLAQAGNAVAIPALSVEFSGEEGEEPLLPSQKPREDPASVQAAFAAIFGTPLQEESAGEKVLFVTQEEEKPRAACEKQRRTVVSPSPAQAKKQKAPPEESNSSHSAFAAIFGEANKNL